MSASDQPHFTDSLRRISDSKEFAAFPTTGYRPAENGPMERFSYRFGKRSLDLTVSILLLPALCPVFFIIAAILVLDDPGPIFFSHRRIRRAGSYFGMWKFRTMCANADAVLEDYLQSHPEHRHEWRTTHKLRCDPRITRFGAFLRRTSLDELPQIWNVLNGTMSLVGPRPIVDAEVPKYGEHFARYCQVKPGVTGLWQVSGRSEVSYETRVLLDCSYVEEWSLSRDVGLLGRTVSAVFHQEGAY